VSSSIPKKPHEVALVGCGFVLNLIWELSHSPLYADHGMGLWHVAWTRFYCTLGDVLILLGAFWTTGAVFRSRQWPSDGNRAAGVLFILLGFTYTAWSEWFKSVVRGSWEYASAMPRILGLGLTPLLQWLVVPPVLLWIVRHKSAPTLRMGEPV
jgi:hypothetical protein